MIKNIYSKLLSWFKYIKQIYIKPRNKIQLVKLLREVQSQELFSSETLNMIEGALNVSEEHVKEVMIPRMQMICLELNAPPNELVKIIVDSGHSRFPVISENRDDVQGIFLAKDLLDYYAKDSDYQFNMRDMMRQAVFIPESKRLNILLREFRTSHNHMAIVVDEYSGVAGLVTIEDVLEQIVGEIDDEYDVNDEVFIKKNQNNNSYTVLALTPIEDFNRYFKTQLDDDEYDTISGLLLKAFGHLPKKGESIKLEQFHFKVIQDNARRIKVLQVELLENNIAQIQEESEL
ncbi:MAG: CBS domain-containing protein [Thiomargarita sp.]|nr:CBS domain-containing protein [Thiomargarita sp.]